MVSVPSLSVRRLVVFLMALFKSLELYCILICIHKSYEIRLSAVRDSDQYFQNLLFHSFIGFDFY